MPSLIELTRAEHQLLHSLVASASNKTIAAQLGKSKFTVRNLLSHVFRKIAVSIRMNRQGPYFYGPSIIYLEVETKLIGVIKQLLFCKFRNGYGSVASKR